MKKGAAFPRPWEILLTRLAGFEISPIIYHKVKDMSMVFHEF